MGVPTIENKIGFKFQNTKVASAKVAFDSVRELNSGSGSDTKRPQRETPKRDPGAHADNKLLECRLRAAQAASQAGKVWEACAQGG